jgi:hypothetical protein
MNMQTAELRNHVLAWTEVQVVRVAKHDRRAERAQLVGVDALHRRLRPDGHERGRRHVAVRRRQHSGASGAVACGDLKAHVRLSVVGYPCLSL